MGHAHSKPRRATTPWRIRLGVLAGFAVFLATMAVIYYQFITTPETDCTILVFGNKTFDQAVVSVDTISTADNVKQSFSVKLEEANGYSARFFLPSGTYRVTLPNRDGLTPTSHTPFVPPGFRQTYDLAKVFPLKAEDGTKS